MNRHRPAFGYELDAAAVALVGHDRNWQAREPGQNVPVLCCRRDCDELDRTHCRLIAPKIADRNQCVDREPGAARFLDDDRGELMRTSEWKMVVGQEQL